MLTITSAHSFQHFKVSVIGRKPYSPASEYKIKGIQDSSNSLAKLSIELGPYSGYRSQHLFTLFLKKKRKKKKEKKIALGLNKNK